MRRVLLATVALVMTGLSAHASGPPFESYYGFGYGEGVATSSTWTAHGVANAAGEVALDAHVTDLFPTVNRTSHAGAVGAVGRWFHDGSPTFKLSPGVYSVSVTVTGITGSASALGLGHAFGQFGLSLSCLSCQLVEGTPYQFIVSTIPALAPSEVSNGSVMHSLRFRVTSPESVNVDGGFDILASTGPLPAREAVGFGEATVDLRAMVSDISLTKES